MKQKTLTIDSIKELLDNEKKKGCQLRNIES